MDCQKHLFSIPEDHHYLNCAYFSPMLKSVEEAGIAGIRQKRAPWKVGPDEFFASSNRLRELYAELIHAENPRRVAILPAASYGLSTVARNLPEAKGKNIVIAGEQFPSNVYPWMRYCRENDSELRIVSPATEQEHRGNTWNRRLLEAIDRDTLLVALGNVHWTDGTIFDLSRIGDRAREVDAWFVIDGTQSVGAMPFDQREIRADAVICAGYKWLMGPYSIAMGYFGDRMAEGVPLEENWLNRKGSEDFAGLVDFEEAYQPGAVRYDVGESSNFILVPMMIRALEQILEWGPANIQQYCGQITQGIREELEPHGYSLEEDEWRAKHLFGIRLPKEIEPKPLQQKLTENKIHVSVRGSAVRVAPNVYNERGDLKALVEMLRSLS